MKRAITETAIALRLVWFRIACYFAMRAWVTFKTLTVNITAEQWAALGSFDKAKIYGEAVYAGLFALVAFIDSAMGKARQQAQERMEQEKEKIKLDP